MKYKAVLYDMDGTVLDSLSDLCNAVNHILEQYNMPTHDRMTIARHLGNGARYLLAHCAPEGTSEETVDKMLKDYGPWYDSHCAILTAPYEGIIPMMETLRSAGVKQGVMSNKQDSAVKTLCEQYFPGLLECALGESETVRRKPNPDAVLKALEEMGIDKSEAIYVGDTEVDIQTSVNADMPCAVVTWGFRSKEELIAAGGKLFFDTADELCTWLMD